MAETDLGLRHPEPGDANDVSGDIQNLAEDVDAMPGISSLSQTQINALSSGKKRVGRVVWNSTISAHQRWTGSKWETITQVPRCKIRLSTGATVNVPAFAGTLTAVTLNTSVIDPWSMKSGNTIVIPEEGDYLVNIFVQFDDEAVGDATLRRAVAGGIEVQGSATTDGLRLQTSDLAHFSKDDVVSLSVANHASTSKTVIAASLSVVKVG